MLANFVRKYSKIFVLNSFGLKIVEGFLSHFETRIVYNIALISQRLSFERGPKVMPLCT